MGAKGRREKITTTTKKEVAKKNYICLEEHRKLRSKWNNKKISPAICFGARN